MIVNRQRKITRQGFTLLEMVLVILIVGIMAVAVTPKWTGNALLVQYEARRVLNDIRYAQAMSLASGQRYRWVRTSATTYQILNEAGAAIILPNGATTLTLSNGTTFGAFSNLPNDLVAFDARGAPYVNTLLPGTSLMSAATIPLISSTETQTIVITPTTGYGELQS